MTLKPEKTKQKREEELINKAAETIVKYGMSTPAILFLEAAKPLSVIGSALIMQFTGAFKWIFGSGYDEFIPVIEKRENLERIIKRIEELESIRG